ncbi:MAG: hypothetical protein ACHQ17_06805, partial [Polyangia bacterium]
MTLTPRELHDVCDEIERFVAERPGAAIVQKVVEPDGASLLVGLKGGWLYLSADARLGRLHLLDEKPPGSGAEAPAFCMLVRKELIGA